MREPLVTVVIPSYNYGHFVTQAVECALGQTYPHVEVIVVDDGSTDDTAQRLAPHHGRIRYLRQENQGLSAARNTGIRAGRGDWIALLDADDLWHPRKLEAQVRCLEEYSSIGLLGTRDVVNANEAWPEFDAAGMAVRPIPLDELVLRAPFGPSSVLLRRYCLDRVGLFDPALNPVADRDMWLRVGAHFPVARLEAPLCHYRHHGANMSLDPRLMEEHGYRMLRKCFAEVAPLRRRRLLLRLAWSHAAYRASSEYLGRAMPARSLLRLLYSLWLWPFPYQRRDVPVALARPRRLAVLLARLLTPASNSRRLA